MVLHFLRNWKVVNNLTCLLDRNPTNYFVYLTGGALAPFSLRFRFTQKVPAVPASGSGVLIVNGQDSCVQIGSGVG